MKRPKSWSWAPLSRWCLGGGAKSSTATGVAHPGRRYALGKMLSNWKMVTTRDWLPEQDRAGSQKACITDFQARDDPSHRLSHSTAMIAQGMIATAMMNRIRSLGESFL